MQFRSLLARVVVAGAAAAALAPIASHDTAARTRSPSHAAAYANTRAIQAGFGHARREYSGYGRNIARFGYSGRLQCVPFARDNTGIELSGNAVNWWQNAEGVYERGARPEVGSVLNFRASGRMHMGHVAVVSSVVDSRNVLIDHANWAGPGASRGGVSRDITVVDVSERNDWTAVRVALGHTGEFGSVYPTFGFIYDRPDRGTMVANNVPTNRTTPVPVLNPAPRDLRPAAERALVPVATQDVEEVAEATDDVVSPRGHHVVARHGRMAMHTATARAAVVRVGHAGPLPAPAAAAHSHHHRRT